MTEVDESKLGEEGPVYTPEQGAIDGQFIANILDIHIGERFRKDMGDVDDLAMDLKDNGQLQPILLRLPFDNEEAGDSSYVLVAGGRRMAAAMKIGWTKLAAFVRSDIDTPVQHLISELHENLKRHDMSWQEQADMKKAILNLRREQDPDITATEVAHEIGDNASSFSRDIDASEAMEAAPGLRKSASRKSALRARDAAALLGARIRRDIENKEALQSIGDNIVVGDAANFLQTYDGYFDLCVTDPPWGIDFFKGGQKSKKKKREQSELSEFDDSKESALTLYRKIFPGLARAMRETGWVLMFGSAESIPVMRGVWENICSVHHMQRFKNKSYCDFDTGGKDCSFYSPAAIPWIWYRPNSRNPSRYPERLAQNVYEYILVVNMGQAMLAKPTQNLFVCDAVYDDRRVHVNQKPLELIVEILTQIGYPGDRFVDIFHGSGMHLAAATSMSMEIHGCDNNPEMHELTLGVTAHHYKEAPPSVRDLSEQRFKTRLAALSFSAAAPTGDSDDGTDRKSGTLDDDVHEDKSVLPGSDT